MPKTKQEDLCWKIKMRKSALLNFIFSLIAVFQYFQVTAQNEISDSLVAERIQYIQKMLDQGKPPASIWWNAWLYGYSAATLVQGAVFLTADKLKTRQDMALGAATTLIGAAGQLLMPMVPAYAPRKLALIRGESPEERLIKLKKAEDLFEESAVREREGRSWKMHAASGAVNLGSGLVTWLGYKRTVWAGLGNFAFNTVITEAQIWTQPTRAIKDYKDYCEKYKSGIAYTDYKPRPHLFVNAYPGGLALRLVF